MDKIISSANLSRIAVVCAAVVIVAISGFIVLKPTKEPVAVTDSEPSSSTADQHTSTPVSHANIIATVFWVGEPADDDNDFIQNRSSAWMEDWQSAYGGIDSDDNRCGYNPCGFTPKENPFYFALPFNDYAANGDAKPASVLKKIYWYTAQPQPGKSLLKNRWVKISLGDKTAYAQWEDVGPFGEDDVDYVFGNHNPKESRAGIDLSPAAANYLSVDGRANVSWQFVDESQVPEGPWKATVTTSGLKY